MSDSEKFLELGAKIQNFYQSLTDERIFHIDKRHLEKRENDDDRISDRNEFIDFLNHQLKTLKQDFPFIEEI